MKKIPQIVPVSFMAITIAMISGCKKYEEGPALSLRSRTARVENVWKVEKYIKNGTDETAEFNIKKRDYSETFTKDGMWSHAYIDEDNDAKADVGTWSFDKDDTEIDRNAGGSTWEELYILRLKSKEFWFWYMDSGDKKEFHMVPK